MPKPGRRIATGCLLPAAIGAATGGVVAGLSHLTEGVALQELAGLPGLLPALFSPLALLVTLAVSHFVTRVSKPTTAELYIETYHSPEARLPLRQLPGRIIAACTTVGFGGSQGLESPSALLGAAFGDVLGHARGFALEAYERRSLLVAGAGAGIAAVFSSPGVGMLYGMEIPFRRDVDAPRLIPAGVAAATAYATRTALVGPSHLVVLHAPPSVDFAFLAGALLVALASGLAAWLFASIDRGVHDLSHRIAGLSRAALAGAILTGLAVAGFTVTGRWITFGPGYIAADWLFAGPHPIGLLGLVVLVRSAGTLVCVFGGGGGGVFTSLACTGAFVGEIVSQLCGRTDASYALLGAACVLGAGYHIPLACMLYVAEAGGGVTFSLLGIAAVALAQVLVGDASVSEAQATGRARA
jgi:CIC family chloride channel protein